LGGISLCNDSSNVRTGGQAAYKERPTWLDLAHRKLDEAVFAAYGWDPAISDDDLLAKLLDLNPRSWNAHRRPGAGGRVGASLYMRARSPHAIMEECLP